MISSEVSTPLVVHNVRKTYRQGKTPIDALDGVSLTVKHGEWVAVMGASGSGKSTLLHAIARLIDVDEGRVLIAGQDLAELSDGPLTRFRRDNLGIVFQAYNLLPSLSAEANIRLPAPHSKELDNQVSNWLEQLGMTSRRNHKPGELSGGEQQRIAIARALICNPAILLADEPTGSLDSVTGTQICQLLRRLVDDQRHAIVMATHDPLVAMWADRICVLKDGKNLAEFETDGRRDVRSVAKQYQQLREAEVLQ